MNETGDRKLEQRISKSQLKWLATQIDAWREREILSSVQAESVFRLYPTPSEITVRHRSLFLLALMGAAVSLMGFGVLLLVGFNWKAMPDAIKLLILFIAMIGTQVLALHLRFNRRLKIWSEACFLAVGILYGVGIFLVAQIFHLNAHYPDGVYWWALGVLPMAVCMDTLLLHILLVALLGVWCEMEVVHFSNMGIWFFGRWDGIHNGAYSLPILAIPGFVWAYRKESPVAVGLYASLVGWWAVLQPIGFHSFSGGVLFIGMIGGLMLALAESHDRGSRFAISFRIPGVVLTGISLLALGNWQFVRSISVADVRACYVPTTIVCAAASVMIVANVLIAKRRSDRSVSGSQEVRDRLLRQLLPVGLMLLTAVTLASRNGNLETRIPVDVFNTIDLGLVIASNIAELGLASWLMAVGLRDDERLSFTAGVLCFLLWAVTRYVDLFADFGGMLGASLLFILCGGLLLGATMYWIKREKLQHE